MTMIKALWWGVLTTAAGKMKYQIWKRCKQP